MRGGVWQLQFPFVAFAQFSKGFFSCVYTSEANLRPLSECRRHAGARQGVTRSCSTGAQPSPRSIRASNCHIRAAERESRHQRTNRKQFACTTHPTSAQAPAQPGNARQIPRRSTSLSEPELDSYLRDITEILGCSSCFTNRQDSATTRTHSTSRPSNASTR